MEQILKIAGFILDSFIHIWPYLLITIPMAVIVKLSGAAKYINKALSKKPLVSILLATIIGAFSPFCSCGVIPIITSLLIGGVPLAPVMSFWIASPSMDPEIFFLSTASIGWSLAIWRLAATFFISLSAGYITHLFLKKGLLGTNILKSNSYSPALLSSAKHLLHRVILNFKGKFSGNTSSEKITLPFLLSDNASKLSGVSCCIGTEQPVFQLKYVKAEYKEKCHCNNSPQIQIPSLQRKIWTETWKALIMVGKFMTLAFLINALINFYVPAHLVAEVLGGKGSLSVVLASLVGIPVYTSNITALPLISGLLSVGMNKGAALAFLISGPMTTLPAMTAVWGIVRIRVFLLYLSFAILGSIFFGLLYNFIN